MRPPLSSAVGSHRRQRSPTCSGKSWLLDLVLTREPHLPTTNPHTHTHPKTFQLTDEPPHAVFSHNRAPQRGRRDTGEGPVVTTGEPQQVSGCDTSLWHKRQRPQSKDNLQEKNHPPPSTRRHLPAVGFSSTNELTSLISRDVLFLRSARSAEAFHPPPARSLLIFSTFEAHAAWLKAPTDAGESKNAPSRLPYILGPRCLFQPR